MAELPGDLDASRDRDLEGRARHQWQRRLGLLALAALVVAALFNVFGQREVESNAATPAASLQVIAPEHLRPGLIFEGQFRIEAEEALEQPTLVLAPGWLDSVTLNSLEPAPKDERSRPDGSLALLFPAIPAGGAMTFNTMWQVNPTAFGRKPTDVTLLDGDRELARIDRKTTIYP
jgi:hypothetical protein